MESYVRSLLSVYKCKVPAEDVKIVADLLRKYTDNLIHNITGVTASYAIMDGGSKITGSHLSACKSYVDGRCGINKTKSTRSGMRGGATGMPPQYYNPSYVPPDAAAGHDRLFMTSFADNVRPAIDSTMDTMHKQILAEDPQLASMTGGGRSRSRSRSRSPMRYRSKSPVKRPRSYSPKKMLSIPWKIVQEELQKHAKGGKELRVDSITKRELQNLIDGYLRLLIHTLSKGRVCNATAVKKTIKLKKFSVFR